SRLAVSTIACTCSGSVTSTVTATARPPACSISLATVSALSPRTSATTTDAPSRATRFAAARPIPWPPPVTMATLPVSRPWVRFGDEGGRQSRVYDSWVDRVDPHVVPGEVERGVAHERDDAALRGAVRDRVLLDEERVRRGDDHDGPAPGLAHGPRVLLGGQE